MELIITNRKGMEFTVLYDEIDDPIINAHTWHATREINPYARTMIMQPNGKFKGVQLHRLILGIEGTKKLGDHKNRNTLDNRRENLRIATHSENCKNRISAGESKYLGVCKSTGRAKWQATIKVKGRYKMLGRFDSEEAAAIRYDAAAKIHHGEFANLNFK